MEVSHIFRWIFPFFQIKISNSNIRRNTHVWCAKNLDFRIDSLSASRIRDPDPILKFWFAGSGSGQKWTGSATLLSTVGTYSMVPIQYHEVQRGSLVYQHWPACSWQRGVQHHFLLSTSPTIVIVMFFLSVNSCASYPDPQFSSTGYASEILCGSSILVTGTSVTTKVDYRP